ncbi:type II secretion system F family protein [Luteolibacter marinus]|uniref:type II secretion system F family protein n=1 Tax=Luteolibacter marinus TaxID=2776705 RepID=UPI001865B160|nr:type II secretion system F family protein [Luteolibacter marinus]
MGFQAAQKHLFYTEIAKLLEAGFGIREAAAAMLDTKLPGVQSTLLEEMDRELEAGKSITESFGRDNQLITPLERSVIGAGERGGRMAAAFQHLADYYGMLAAARQEAIRGMAYPALLLHLGLFVGVLAPGLLHGSPWTDILKSFVLAVLAVYAAGFVIWLGARALLAAAPGNASLDRAINLIPVIGKARRSMAMARFTKVYHICLLAGLSMEETVKTSARSSRSGVIGEAGLKLESALADGKPLGPEFIACGAFPKAFARSYATAEESGGLDKDLARWAGVYQDDAAAAVRTLSAVASKLAYFLVVLFIAWTVIRVYSGMYSDMYEMLEE